MLSFVLGREVWCCGVGVDFCVVCSCTDCGVGERQRLTEAVRMHRLEWTREPAEPARTS